MSEIHCSAIGRILACPMSRQAPDIRIEPDVVGARLGSAVHAAIAEFIQQGTQGSKEYYSARFDLAPEQEADFGYLVREAIRQWEELRPMLTDVEVEAATVRRFAEGWDVAGRPDVWAHLESSADRVVVIIDWKTERIEADHRDQMMGYAWLAFDLREPGRVKLTTVRLRDGVRDIEDVSQDELQGWEDRLKAALGADYYCPGACCDWCPLQLTCEARARWLRGATLGLPALTLADSPVLAAQKLADWWPRVKALEIACDRYRLALKTALAASGPQTLSDGSVLELEAGGRETIEVSEDAIATIGKSLGVPSSQFEDGEQWEGAVLHRLMSALSIAKGKLGQIVAASVEKGKGKAREALFKALRDAGCVTKSEWMTPVQRQPVKEIEGKKEANGD